MSEQAMSQRSEQSNSAAQEWAIVVAVMLFVVLYPWGIVLSAQDRAQRAPSE